MKAILLTLLALTLLTGLLPALDTMPEQRYNDGGQWRRPHPGPDQAEMNLITGTYRLRISGAATLWENKLLKVSEIRSIPVKDVYPHLTQKATLTVPESWDTVSELALDGFRFEQRFDERSQRTRITGFVCTIELNLKESGRQTFEFTGYYIEANRSFAGILKQNGTIVGGFVAAKQP